MLAVSVSNITKKYKISKQGKNYLSLRDKISQIFRGNNFVFDKSCQNEFNALDDVSLDINEGEIFGIVGDNGSGKSTLLKIISRVTNPTTGKVVVRGKIASILEVGTGFHPELSGRENIYLNGAILGMKRGEIEKKFDEIVRFSGVGGFLDTPVKHYSSGMFTRLAFSIAINMEADILLIDEVLAVGDIGFQKKCLMKMDEIKKGGKKTILFVSHNLQAVQSLCDKCLLLQNGRIDMKGESKEVIQRYIKRKSSESLIKTSFESEDFRLLSFELENGIYGGFSIHWKSPAIIKIKILSKVDINYLSFIVGFATLEGNIIYNSWDIDYIKRNFSLQKSKIYEIALRVNHNLNVGNYSIGLSILGGHKIYENYNQAVLEVVGGHEIDYAKKNNGVVNFKADWSMREL